MSKTKINLFAKMFIVIACVISGICLTGCLQTSQNITDIAIISATVPAEIEMGKFNDANILIKVTYEDGTMKNEKVTLDMIDEANKQIINTQIGTYEITIKFRGKETKLTVNIVEKSYTVKFYNANGILIYREDNVKSGSAANEPSKSARECEGFTFVCWDRTFNNVTEDIEVHGIYTKVDNTLPTDVLASKLTNAYNGMETTSHSYTVSFDDTNESGSDLSYSAYYSYTAANNITSYSYENKSIFKYDGAYLSLNADYGISRTSAANFNKQNEANDYNNCVEHFLLTGRTDYTLNIQYYLAKATTKKYSILKIANKGNAYLATLEFTDEESQQIKCEIIYDDEYILSIKETKGTAITSIYCDYVQKEIPTNLCELDFEADKTKIKSLLSTLIASNHHLLTDDSQTISYSTTTKKYTFKSTELNLLEPFNAAIDSAAEYTYQYENDETSGKLSSTNFALTLSINEEFSVTISFTNEKITKIAYTADSINDFNAQVVLGD